VVLKRVIVCMKPVPDPKEWNRLQIDPQTKTLIREGMPSVINPLDKHALEAALQIKDALNVEVVLLSMAPPLGATFLREALGMGADRGVLLSDKVFAGSDTLATARIISRGIRHLGAFDLVFCGNSTLDCSTGQVPSQIAELLGIPSVMHISEMEMKDKNVIRLTQNIEHGHVRLEAEPPLLISFLKEANEPRLISFLGILEAEKREISIWSNAELGLDPLCLGLSGSPTKMADMLLRKKERRGERLEGDPAQLAGCIAERIYQLGFI
jgi:electron transfer flavoprotein beta subunit